MAHTTRHLPGRGRVGRVGEGWGATRWEVFVFLFIQCCGLVFRRFRTKGLPPLDPRGPQCAVVVG